MRPCQERTGILNRAGQASDNSKRASFIEQVQLDLMAVEANANGNAKDSDMIEVLQRYFSGITATTLTEVRAMESLTPNATYANDNWTAITPAEVLGTVATTEVVSGATLPAGTYTAGQEVTFGGEKFFVVADDGDTVRLLAKYCVKSDGSEQYDKNATYSTYGRVFSSTNYWSSVSGITYPYDLQNPAERLDLIPSTDTTANNAILCAQAYGTKKGVTGRLMTEAEADAMVSSNSAIMYGKWTDGTGPTQGWLRWWLGAAGSTNVVWYVGGSSSRLYYNGSRNTVNGVRPVLEISES